MSENVSAKMELRQIDPRRRLKVLDIFLVHRTGMTRQLAMKPRRPRKADGIRVTGGFVKKYAQNVPQLIILFYFLS
jgi:hypothetical protein